MNAASQLYYQSRDWRTRYDWSMIGPTHPPLYLFRYNRIYLVTQVEYTVMVAFYTHRCPMPPSLHCVNIMNNDQPDHIDDDDDLKCYPASVHKKSH